MMSEEYTGTESSVLSLESSEGADGTGEVGNLPPIEPETPGDENPSEGEDPEMPEEPEEPEEPEPEDELSVKEYLQGISPLLTEGVLRVILRKRKLKGAASVDELDERDLDLAEAEVYYHLSNLPVGGATTKDVDGSWSHTEGGWTVSGANIAEWYRKYAALREKWGEEVITKRRIRIINL